MIALLTGAASSRLIQSAHDCSDGGLAVTLAEAAFDSGGIGCTVDFSQAATEPEGTEWARLGALFGESGGRVMVSVKPEHRDAFLELARSARVPASVIGRTGGTHIVISVNGSKAIDIAVSEAEQLWSSALERHFAGKAA